MRAKQLQIIKMGKNYNMSRGAETILYNLAFSPRITHIDFSDDLLNNADIAEAVYKLIKISGSLETLILHNTQINNYLKEEFFIALGENKTLVNLNLNNTTYTNTTQLNLLGKAIAMNAKKSGSLKYVSLINAFQSYAIFRAFFDSFKISDHDHEMWYGDKKIAKDMTKEQLEKKFHSKLAYLNMGVSILSGNAFKFKELSKYQKPSWPSVLEAFTTQALQTVNLSVCNLNSKDMELFAYGLHQNP